MSLWSRSQGLEPTLCLIEYAMHVSFLPTASEWIILASSVRPWPCRLQPVAYSSSIWGSGCHDVLNSPLFRSFRRVFKRSCMATRTSTASWVNGCLQPRWMSVQESSFVLLASFHFFLNARQPPQCSSHLVCGDYWEDSFLRPRRWNYINGFDSHPQRE